MNHCDKCRKKKTCKRQKIIDGKGCVLFSDPFNRKCFTCGSNWNIEEHHIFGASNRKRSTREGLTVDLCPDCHRTGKNAVHRNAEKSRELKAIGQKIYEQAYGKDTFLPEFGRNYL